MQNVTIITAFLAGLASCVSPCVLPLIPPYISYITNISIEELKKENNQKATSIKVSVNSLLFIFGFSIVFIALGVSATVLGKLILKKFDLLMRIAGIVIILFGLHSIGIFNLSWLYKEKRFDLSKISFGFFTPTFMGMAFAFGWTPCIGPILATILTLAATQENIKQGIILLTIYSLGLGIPFFLIAIMFNKFLNLYAKITKYFRIIEIISGLLLIIVGILIFTNNFQRLTGYFSFQ